MLADTAFIDVRHRAVGLTSVSAESRSTPVAARWHDMRFEGERAGGFAEREQNLTWTAELGEDNRIIAGRWWGPRDAGQPLVSVAEEFAEALRLQVGDRLDFNVAGERVSVSVASLRKVRWDSFRPNFFLVFPPGRPYTDCNRTITHEQVHISLTTSG